MHFFRQAFKQALVSCITFYSHLKSPGKTMESPAKHPLYWNKSINWFGKQRLRKCYYIHYDLTCICINDDEPGAALCKWSWAVVSYLYWRHNKAYKAFNNMNTLCFYEAATYLHWTWKQFLFQVKMPSPLFKMWWHVICYSAS